MCDECEYSTASTDTCSFTVVPDVSAVEYLQCTQCVKLKLVTDKI